MKRHSLCQAVMILLACLGCLPEAVAQDDMAPRISVRVTPESVSVGEPLELEITVLVPTWFAQPPVYPSFELPNAIVRRPPDSSYPTSQRVGRDTWSGIVRKYRVYPLVGADFVLADRQIKVTMANPGKDPVVAMEDIPEIRFSATVPVGAESLSPYLSGTDLELVLDVIGTSEDLAAGDALVIEYRAELDGLPAMFLPSLAPDIDLAGVSVYRDEPSIADGPPARRSERVTLVFEAGGEFAVPGFGLDYWDTNASSIGSAAADGFSVSVTGPPLTPPMEAQEQRGWQRPAIIGLVLLATVVILRLAVPAILQRRRAARERWLHSETWAFKQAGDRLRAGDSTGAYPALVEWLKRLDPGEDLRSFAYRYGSAELAGNLDTLSAKLYNNASADASLEQIRHDLSTARARYLEQQEESLSPPLPPLNPSA